MLFSFSKHQTWCLCLCCSISILHYFNEECTSINSNIIICPYSSSPLDLLEFQLPLFVQVLLFHPKNKEKVFRYVRHSHLHFNDFSTTQSDLCLSREKKTTPLCCSLLIHLSYEMHVFIRSFLKLLFLKNIC